MDEEAIFRGLSDAHRRWILDALFERDGQTLGELCELFPDMSRFGVMKHLDVLETAGLISTRKHGRSKLHFLNPVPIVWIHDRWIAKYAEPWARGLGRLKYAIEEKAMERPSHVYKQFIRATPEAVWNAITDGAMTKQYFYGTRVQSSWETGAQLDYFNDQDGVVITGTVLESDPPRKLVYTWVDHFSDPEGKEKPSRITWEIEQNGAVCALTLIHDDFEGETQTYKNVGGGWPWVLSNMKTLLETGATLPQE